jgi:bacterioferritin-associated ferredoxin
VRHCGVVTDAHVRETIEAGATDEADIGRLCGAGTGCGSCHDELRRLCDESRSFATSRREMRSLVNA